MLVLTDAQKHQIEREALGAYPNECCGVIVGRADSGEHVASSLVPMPNAFEASQRHHRFSIDPRQLMDADRKAAERGEIVLGFYHSHPDHPADPSEFDREHAWPFYSYVIISVTRDGADEMKNWQFDEQMQQFVARQIRVAPTGGGRKDPP